MKYIGEAYHANWLPAEKLLLLEINADHWKSWVHQRLGTPVGSAGAMTLFSTPDPQEHLGFARHLTAEVRVEQFIAGKGVQIRWERVRKQNHYLDALYNACAAGHGAGVRLLDEVKPEPPPKPPYDPERHITGEQLMKGYRKYSW